MNPWSHNMATPTVDGSEPFEPDPHNTIKEMNGTMSAK